MIFFSVVVDIVVVAVLKTIKTQSFRLEFHILGRWRRMQIDSTRLDYSSFLQKRRTLSTSTQTNSDEQRDDDVAKLKY